MEYAVDKRLFEELSRRDPQEVELPQFCIYNELKQCFDVSAWKGNYQISPAKASIEPMAGTPKPFDFFAIFLVNYLLSEKCSIPEGEWISEKDLVGGVTFFRGPHEVPTKIITRRFGDNLDLLRDRCIELGGQPLDMADLSYSFEIIGSVRVALLYWQGDEDFATEAKLLFDKSLATTLALDVVYALLCAVCESIASPGDKYPS